MLQLKGKLKRLDGGMPRYTFWELMKENAHKHGFVYSPSSVRGMVATVYRVKDEHVTEVAGCVQMLCDGVTITWKDGWLIQVLGHFDLRPIRSYQYGHDTLAVETDKCWLVYPLNLRHVNWQLRRRHG